MLKKTFSELDPPPLKRLGQNFLNDPAYQNKIVEALHLDQTTLVVEVGPGKGAITAPMAKVAGRIVAIEIDRALAKSLAERFSDTNVQVVHDDALKADFAALSSAPSFPRKIFVANLPYYIATSLVVKAASAKTFSELFFMSQRELADRYLAAPGSKAYGAVTVLLQLLGRLELLFAVPKTAFFPIPDVESVFMKMTMLSSLSFEPSLLGRFVRLCFASRRKTIRNNLLAAFKAMSVDACLLRAEISGSVRAETLSPKDFLRLYRCFKELDSEI